MKTVFIIILVAWLAGWLVSLVTWLVGGVGGLSWVCCWLVEFACLVEVTLVG